MQTATAQKTHIFGIRHHGPGCARSLRAALEALEPDIVLIEGPPDAQALLPLMLQEEMRPPVALLVYAPDQPKKAAYYPFTHFSPEWQALRYALQKEIPARFMDLPQAIRMAKEAPAEVSAQEPETPSEESPATPPAEPEITVPDDPMALLAEAAGYSDHELWWEQQIEQRYDASHLFDGILEAMTALRTDLTPKNEEEAQREAYMRQTIRAAQKEGFQRIAIVCGAWHAPALVEIGPAKADAAILNGLKRTKVETTWIPWTNSRLSYRSGYGAGVTSPGWYEHLWTAPDRVTIRWQARAASLLRSQGLDASSASVIEAVRLSETLAALRDLPMPGLAEQHEAILTVLCNGKDEPMSLIRDKLEIGEHMGEVPPETPSVPLQKDLEAKQRRLRLKPTPDPTTLDLDLRKENDLARSHMLHQLRLLGIKWGKLQHTTGKLGTFHELWQLQWQVEFAISLIEANIWGNTLETASTAFVRQKAELAQDLPPLSELLDKTILANLGEATEFLLQQIQRCAAQSTDIRHLMNSLPALARVARYGNVRQTRAEQILPVIDGLFERVVIGLPGACTGLNDDAAKELLGGIEKVQESINLLDREEQRSEWQGTLRGLMLQEDCHGLIRGRSCRLLLEQHVVDEAELQRQTHLALSPAAPVQQAAAWIEGILRGSGLLILHQDGLWRSLNAWLCDLETDVFDMLLPILRRAFSGFQQAERRQMGEKVKRLGNSAPAQNRQLAPIEADDQGFNQERAHAVLPVLAQIMGVTYNGN